MVSRLLKIAIFVAILAVLVFFLSQEEYQRPIKRAWRDVQKSEGWKSIKKTWDKGYKKTQQLITKIQQGKLSEDMGTFIDQASQSHLGVGLADLEMYLQKMDSGRAGTILFVAWLVIGYIFYSMTSTGSAVFVMAVTLLVHSVYGQTWCLYQLCILVGLGMYFISLIANNAVLAAFVVFIIYVFTTLFFFMGSRRGDIYILEEKMDGIHYRTSMVEQRVSRMDKKLDKWMKKKKNQSSSGDE